MLDVDTFLTILYVIVDDLCQPHASQQRRPGPPASLSESEVIALAIFARWSRFSSERDFYRYAEAHLRAAFPTLPDRSQFNRLVRFYAQDIEEIAVKLGEMLEGEAHPYPRHSIVRRCPSGTPSAGVTAGSPGKPTHRLVEQYRVVRGLLSSGCYRALRGNNGFLFRLCFYRRSAIGLKTFFALRANPNPRLKGAGSAFLGTYVADKGFEGEENHRRWLQCYGAEVVHPPRRRNSKKPWSKRLRRWIAGIRQIVETLYDKLFNAFGLWQERPHEIGGLRARLAARVALHNFCIWLNDQLGRPRLAFADLLGW